jgi:RND superfamily putative drug exporter
VGAGLNQLSQAYNDVTAKAGGLASGLTWAVDHALYLLHKLAGEGFAADGIGKLQQGVAQAAGGQGQIVAKLPELTDHSAAVHPGHGAHLRPGQLVAVYEPARGP